MTPILASIFGNINICRVIKGIDDRPIALPICSALKPRPPAKKNSDQVGVNSVVKLEHDFS